MEKKVCGPAVLIAQSFMLAGFMHTDLQVTFKGFGGCVPTEHVVCSTPSSVRRRPVSIPPDAQKDELLRDICGAIGVGVVAYVILWGLSEEE